MNRACARALLALVAAAALPVADAGAGPPPVVLRAFVGDVLAWRVEVRHLAATGPQSCSVVSWRGADTRVSEEKLLVRECAELQALLRNAKGLSSEKPAAVLGEPRYELELGRRKHAVNFEAPEKCEIGDEGALACKAQPLSDLQSALLILRAHAPPKSQ